MYLNEANILYKQENYDLSRQNLKISFQFSENISDSWYLAGLLNEKQGNRIAAIELFYKSLEIGNLTYKGYHDSYYSLLNLLNITGQHKKVLEIYTDNEFILENYIDIVLKVSDSAYKYGKIDYSNELAYCVYKKNPNNLKSILFMIRSTKTDSLYNLIENNLTGIESDKYDDEIFQSIILFSKKPLKDRLLRLYNSLFGSDAYYYYANNIKHDLINNSKNLLIRSAGIDRLNDGVYFADYNYDGISDEIISVSGDELTYFKDENQDNIPEVSINFIERKPSHIYVNEGDITIEYKYSNYPYLEEVHYNKEAFIRKYKILPSTIYIPIIGLDDFSWKYESKRNSKWEIVKIKPIDLLQISSSFTEYLPKSHTVFRKYKIIDGEIVQISEDSSLDGQYDHFLNISGWKLLSGKRDVNGDGLIDIFEYYENGKISGVAVDWDNSGRPEYLEDWSVLDIKIWDFDEDSYYNIEDIVSKTNISYNENAYENRLFNKYDILSWDFSKENFWFIKF